MAGIVDFSQPSFWLSAASILFNPTFWNIAARQEYHNKIITRMFGGNPYYGCYALAATIFCLGVWRDHLYTQALMNQPTHPFLTQQPWVTPLAVGLFASGSTLVLSSMWALGVTGTYLGDYFGILMDEKVDSFPFNVTGAPMYWGSTMSFVATALWYGRPAGLLLCVEVWACYLVALGYEDPFTGMIYEKREKERREGKKGS